MIMSEAIFYLKNKIILNIIKIYFEKKGKVEIKLANKLKEDILDFIHRNIDGITETINKMFTNFYSIKFEKKINDLFKEFKDGNIGFELLTECIIDIEKFEINLLFKRFALFYPSECKVVYSDYLVSKINENIVLPIVIKIPLDTELKTKIMLELL